MQKEDDSQKYYHFLKGEWESKTAHLSSLTASMAHPFFKLILRLGERAVPYIIEDIKEEPSWIVLALPIIANTEPDRTPEQGNLRDLCLAWIEWAANRGI